MRLISICGSPGKLSANRAALRHAAAHLTSCHPEIEIDDLSLEGIPVFDPRESDDPPQVVVDLSAHLAGADGLMIAAPEYAGGLSGGTKTALDWMVGLASLYHRPTVVMSAGTTGGEFAIDNLVRTLSWQGALVVATLGIAAPKTKIDKLGEVTDMALASEIETWADDLVAVSSNRDMLKQRLSETVTRFGIDPARFGDLNEQGR